MEVKFTGSSYNVPQQRVKKIVLEKHFCTPALMKYAQDMEKSIAPEPMPPMPISA